MDSTSIAAMGASGVKKRMMLGCNRVYWRVSGKDVTMRLQRILTWLAALFVIVLCASLLVWLRVRDQQQMHACFDRPARELGLESSADIHKFIAQISASIPPGTPRKGVEAWLSRYWRVRAYPEPFHGPAHESADDIFLYAEDSLCTVLGAEYSANGGLLHFFYCDACDSSQLR
jgi:hypothetical protein